MCSCITIYKILIIYNINNIKYKIDEFEIKEAYSKPKGDIYFCLCKNFKIKDLGDGYSEIICLKGTHNYNCNCKYFEGK